MTSRSVARRLELSGVIVPDSIVDTLWTERVEAPKPAGADATDRKEGD